MAFGICSKFNRDFITNYDILILILKWVYNSYRDTHRTYSMLEKIIHIVKAKNISHLSGNVDFTSRLDMHAHKN